MKKLQDKVCLVTGGGSGIGAGIVEKFAGHGAKITFCGRRPEPLQQAEETYHSNGWEVLALPADVSKEKEVGEVVQTTVRRYGGIDILVNNAGIPGGGFIHSHDLDTWDRVLAINLRGPFLTSRAVLPHMRQKGSGHIINISSEASLEYYPGNGAYGVSKHALNALGEYIQRENQEFGIRVDTICPGMVISEMTVGSDGLDHSKCLYPEDIADLVVWLVTRRLNVKIGRPILIQTMHNPWEASAD